MINVNRPIQTVDKRMNIHRYEMWGSATFRTSGFFIQFCHKAHTRPAHCLMRIVNGWCCGQNPAYPQKSATVNYYHHSVYKLLVVNLATLVQVAGLPKKSRLRPMSVIKASTWQKIVRLRRFQRQDTVATSTWLPFFLSNRGWRP